MHHYFLQIKCSLQVKSLLVSVEVVCKQALSVRLSYPLAVVFTGEALPGGREAGLFLKQRASLAFVSASVLLGMLFALQQWMSVRLWSYHIGIPLLLEASTQHCHQYCGRDDLVRCFPNLPLRHRPMSYWQRLAFQLDAELIYNMVIFRCAFALFRGIGYY